MDSLRPTSARSLHLQPPAAALSLLRRHFLKISAGLGAALLGLGVAHEVASSEIDEGERALLATLTARLCGGRALGLNEVQLERAYLSAADGIARFVAESLRFVPGVARDLRLALLFIEHVPLGEGKLARFGSLETAEQQRLLERFMRSERQLERDVFAALKSLCTLFFYETPAVYERIGYGAPLLAGAGEHHG